MRLNAMTPSGMSNILGLLSPVAAVDRNLSLINARFGLTLAPTATANADSAPATLQGAFTTIAGALNLALYPVAGSVNAEAATQANFELINGVW